MLIHQFCFPFVVILATLLLEKSDILCISASTTGKTHSRVHSVGLCVLQQQTTGRAADSGAGQISWFPLLLSTQRER